jgi:hypothetical protein
MLSYGFNKDAVGSSIILTGILSIVFLNAFMTLVGPNAAQEIYNRMYDLSHYEPFEVLANLDSDKVVAFHSGVGLAAFLTAVTVALAKSKLNK